MVKLRSLCFVCALTAQLSAAWSPITRFTLKLNPTAYTRGAVASNVRLATLDSDRKNIPLKSLDDIFGAKDRMPSPTEYGISMPTTRDELISHVQIEELEDDTTTLTSLSLNADGSFGYIETDGPEPQVVEGSWCTQGDKFLLIIKKTFETLGAAERYSVTRVFDGTVEVEGSIVTAGGEITIENNPVGYFKVLVIPKSDAFGNEEE